MERIRETYDSSLMTCALCKQRCRDPKVLTCLHVCCSTCVASVSSLLQCIRCRKCSEDVSCSKIASLPQRVWHSEMEMNPSDVALDDAGSFGQNRYTGSMKADENMVKCQQHDKEELRYFCYTCEEAICSECLLASHKKHELAKVKECCDRYRAKLAMLDTKAREKVISIKESLDQINGLQQRLFHNADEAKRQIQTEIANLRTKLDLAEEELILEVDKEASRKAFQLQRQEHLLKLAIQKFATAASFANKTVSFANDVEVTLIRKTIHARMDELESIQIETRPDCNEEISQQDLKPKLDLLLRE